jgi:hypothetical protein
MQLRRASWRPLLHAADTLTRLQTSADARADQTLLDAEGSESKGRDAFHDAEAKAFQKESSLAEDI